jgi:hypothetical protein
VTFQGEVLAAMQELQATYAALLDTQDVLAATQQENDALKGRCNEFVKANLDHMLAWRTLKTKADALEGEASASAAVASHQHSWAVVLPSSASSTDRAYTGTTAAA